MRKQLLLLMAMLSFLCSTADAEETSAVFRAGKVVSAEISTKYPKMEGTVRTGSTVVYWAEVVAELLPLRGISIYDYVLVSGVKEFKCVAVAGESETYSTGHKHYRVPSGVKRCRMLFIVELPHAGKPLEYDLRFKLFDSKLPDVTVPFRNMGEDDFSEVKDIPREGLLGVSRDELKKRSSTQEKSIEPENGRK